MKVAAHFGSCNGNRSAIVTTMARAQLLLPTQTYRLHNLDGGTVARIITGDRASKIPFSYNGANGNLLIVTGAPISHEVPVHQLISALVEKDYREAIQVLQGLDGAFAALYWDVNHRKLVIVSDFLGVQPLYIVRGESFVAFATDLKALSAAGVVPASPNPAGWGAFIGMGHFVGNHTSVAGVNRVPAAATLIYDPETDRLEQSKYWEWPAPGGARGIDQVDTGQFLVLLEQDIRAYSAYADNGTLLLSGGFDSRLLAALFQRMGVRSDALIVRHHDEEGDADGRLALRAAKRFNIPSRIVSVAADFYSSEEFLHYLVMSDVISPAINLFIAQVSTFLKPLTGAVWEGVGPGNALAPPPQPPGGFAAYLAAECQSPDSPRWEAARLVFNAHLARDMYEGFMDSLDREKAILTDDAWGVSRFIMENRMRNRTSQNPMKVYANMVLPLTPGLSKEFWTLAAQVPYALKAQHHLYMRMLSRHLPEAMKVPFCSGGKLLNYAPGKDPYRYRRALGRFVRRHVSFRLYQLLGWAEFQYEESGLVDRVLTRIDPDHPDLNGGVVHNFNKFNSVESLLGRRARELLFYWQVWRWLMEGKFDMLTQLNEDPPSASRAAGYNS